MTDKRRHLDHRQQQARARAVQLLQHYVGLLMKKAGLKADADTDAEMEQLVDELLEAATPGKTEHEEAVDRMGLPVEREHMGAPSSAYPYRPKPEDGDDRVVVGIVGLTGDDEPDPRD